METKELKIQVPEGYEIDKDNSTFEYIKFKPKTLTYKDIAKELFLNNEMYFINNNSKIIYAGGGSINYEKSNNCTSRKQAEKLLAINKLMNIAKYLNGDWKPASGKKNFCITINCANEVAVTWTDNHHLSFDIYFRSEAAAKQAIKILGEETIRLAFSTN